tara:strand:- start:162 stop:335 length:174 start_codon:yes stop_codon:yes gene_type:complete
MDEIRFNDVELMLISEAVDSLICSDNVLDPANSQKSDQLRIQRKVSKLLDHPKTEFV